MYANVQKTAHLILAALFAFTILLPKAHADYLKATVSPPKESELSQGYVISDGKVNINTADAALLAKRLKGIGLKKAQAIVEYRNTFGQFASIDELEEVKGIGKALIARNRTVITLD